MVYRLQSYALVSIDLIECKKEGSIDMKKYAQICKDAGVAS